VLVGNLNPDAKYRVMRIQLSGYFGIEIDAKKQSFLMIENHILM
jgi:hypothetical protein